MADELRQDEKTGRVTVYKVETGEPMEVFSVDARELMAMGEVQMTPPLKIEAIAPEAKAAEAEEPATKKAAKKAKAKTGG